MKRYLKLCSTIFCCLGVTSTIGASVANTNISLSLALTLGSALSLVLLNIRSKA